MPAGLSFATHRKVGLEAAGNNNYPTRREAANGKTLLIQRTLLAQELVQKIEDLFAFYMRHRLMILEPRTDLTA